MLDWVIRRTARFRFTLKIFIAAGQKTFIALQRQPMRRCDRDGLAVFADPRTLLRRPASKLIGPTRIILKNDALSVFWYSVYLAAHLTRLSKGMHGLSLA